MYGRTVILVFVSWSSGIQLCAVYQSYLFTSSLSESDATCSRTVTSVALSARLLKNTLAAGLSHLAQLRSRLLTCQTTFARYHDVCSPFSEIKPELELCLINGEASNYRALQIEKSFRIGTRSTYVMERWKQFRKNHAVISRKTCSVPSHKDCTILARRPALMLMLWLNPWLPYGDDLKILFCPMVFLVSR